jgi:hypothetical protein
VTEAASADRATLPRWLREDIAFQAALSALRRDVWEIEANLDAYSPTP